MTGTDTMDLPAHVDPARVFDWDLYDFDVRDPAGHVDRADRSPGQTRERGRIRNLRLE